MQDSEQEIILSNEGKPILEVGGLLQHGAFVPHEYGKPCIADIENVTSLLQGGQSIEMDGLTGIIQVLYCFYWDEIRQYLWWISWKRMISWKSCMSEWICYKRSIACSNVKNPTFPRKVSKSWFLNRRAGTPPSLRSGDGVTGNLLRNPQILAGNPLTTNHNRSLEPQEMFGRFSVPVLFFNEAISQKVMHHVITPERKEVHLTRLSKVLYSTLRSSFPCGSGIFLPSFLAVSSQSSIAILTSFSASSSVAPKAEHPGNSGTTAMYPLSSSL